MPNTIIYKIVCKNSDCKSVYVGKTTNFRNSKRTHKSMCTNKTNKHYELLVYKTIRSNGGWSNWLMVQIETFKCYDDNSASARKRYWIETLKADLNTYTPDRSEEEMKDYHKSYKVKCECGIVTSKYYLSKHETTNKHKKLISLNKS